MKVPYGPLLLTIICSLGVLVSGARFSDLGATSLLTWLAALASVGALLFKNLSSVCTRTSILLLTLASLRSLASDWVGRALGDLWIVAVPFVAVAVLVSMVSLWGFLAGLNLFKDAENFWTSKTRHSPQAVMFNWLIFQPLSNLLVPLGMTAGVLIVVEQGTLMEFSEQRVAVLSLALVFPIGASLPQVVRLRIASKVAVSRTENLILLSLALLYVYGIRLEKAVGAALLMWTICILLLGLAAFFATQVWVASRSGWSESRSLIHSKSRPRVAIYYALGFAAFALVYIPALWVAFDLGGRP